MANFTFQEICSIQNVINHYFSSYQYEKNDLTWIKFYGIIDGIKSINVFKHSDFFHLLVRTKSEDISFNCDDMYELLNALEKTLDKLIFWY